MQVTLSTRAVTGLTKDERQFIKHYQQFIQCEFRDLRYLLAEDYIYSPFNYISYEQNTNNICSDANFVVIDVDSTSISITDRLDILAEEDLQCILSTTSNPLDWYKYRILIPVDKPLSAQEYRGVVTGIAEYGLIPDMDIASAKPAQKFYSYANSMVLSSFTGEPLCTADYAVNLAEPIYSAASPPDDVTELLHEFDSYRYAIKGKRTRSLISAGYKCLELGMTNEQLEQVIYYLNSLFLVPKSHSDINRRVLNFIKQQRRS